MQERGSVRGRGQGRDWTKLGGRRGERGRGYGDTWRSREAIPVAGKGRLGLRVLSLDERADKTQFWPNSSENIAPWSSLPPHLNVVVFFFNV